MFARFTPLESRDVPATWQVTMLSSNPGSTDATITESLVVGTASVTAPTANDAVALAINGNVVVTYSGQTHTYTFGPTSTSGTGAAFRIVGSGSATVLQLEDLAGMPGATPDYDYNDHTWSLNVAQTAANGDPLPEVGIEAIDPTAAEGKSPPGSSTGLFRVSRSGSTTDALTTYVRIETTAGSATNKDDYSELVLDTVTYTTGGGSTTENLYKVTFAPNETYVTIPIVPVDDIMPESTESVQLRVVGIDGKYVASTNKYAVAELLIADNDPFLAPVQKVYFGEGDLVAQPGSNAGLYVFKRTVADSYLTVNYTVGSTASGYTLSGGYGGNTSATFLPGISEVSVNLTMNTNGPPPTSGPVTVTITPSSNYEIMGSPSNTVEIYSIGGPEPWINVFRRVDPVGNTLNEGGSKGQFVVSRYYAYPNGPPPQSIPTPPPLPDFALGGTARAGLDYIATKQATLRVLPAIASSMVFVDGYEVEITPLEDSAYDGGEWVDFALIPNEQSIVPVAEGSTPSFMTLPISDAGTPPKPQISITTPDPNSSELATSSGMYRIMRNDVNLPQSLTINYAFDPTDLTDPATFYDDYTITSSAGGLASSGSLTFPAGVAMIEVKLTPVDDSVLENDELAQLKLLSGSNYVVDVTKSQALVSMNIVGVKIDITGEEYIPLNANNDNGSVVTNLIPATRDFTLVAATTFTDTDIKKIDIAVTAPPGIPLNGTYKLAITQSAGTAGGRVRIWNDQKKTTEFTAGTTFTQATLPTSMYVEGLEPTRSTLTTSGSTSPDVTVEISYVGGNVPVGGVLGLGRRKLTVTPVIRGYDLTKGKLTLLTKIDQGSTYMYAITTEGRGALPGGGFSHAGIDTAASLQKNNLSGGARLIQTSGYVGKNAIENGTIGVLGGFVSSTTRNASLSRNLQQPLQLVLDRIGKNNPGIGANGFTPYYGAQVINAGEVTNLAAADSPEVGVTPDAVNFFFISSLNEIAVRYNMRLHLVWEYPTTANSAAVIYPLAYADWNVYFRASRNAGVPALSPLSTITTSSYLVSHDVPAIMSPPDFNDLIVVN